MSADASVTSPDDVARPGIDQQLVGVEAIALARIVGAVHADAIQRADARQLALEEAVMIGAGAARQREARGLAFAASSRTGTLDARRRRASGWRSSRLAGAVSRPEAAARPAFTGRPHGRLRKTADSGGKRMRSACGKP